MACLILAGEAIFGLPFHVARFFRPTVLEVLSISNTELGVAQAATGTISMISYGLGGPLADRFSARKLISLSLACTACGGFYFATFPPYSHLLVLFGFFGASTILLFWAALIRATREWGGADKQGEAYGLLDGGRGLLAAVIATSALWLFAQFFPEDPTTATDAQRAAALRWMILVYTGTTFCAAIVAWFFIPDTDARQTEARPRIMDAIKTVARFKAIWLQATIVICAYVAYKGLDQYSLFAAQAYGMNEVSAATVGAVGVWVRPFAAIGAGLIGDRFRSSRVVSVCFAALCLSYIFMALDEPQASLVWVLFANVIITCAAAYGLRGIYFALFEEAKVPTAVTGTAVGVVSVLGYTPDIFVAPTAGWLIDRTPGIVGYQHFFMFLLAFALLGFIASVVFQRLVRSDQ